LSARKSETKNGRFASLASNPLVIVPILELWVKWVNGGLIVVDVIEREEVDRYGSMPQVMYRVGDHNGAAYAPSPNVTSLPQRAGGGNGAGNKPRPSSAPGGGVGRNGGFGGGGKYEIFTPSHPQAVNQYVGSYTYGPEPQPQSQNGYKQDLQRYKEELARAYIASSPISV